MKSPSINIISRYLSVILIGISLGTAWSQKPNVQSIDKLHAANDEIITITGSDFGASSDLEVTFGAAKGRVKFSSDEVIEVRVPAAASHHRIAVTRKSLGLTGESKDAFFLSFNGEQGVEASELDGQKDFPAEAGLYDLCGCDFDGDSKVDILATSQNGNPMSLFVNTTENPGIGNITFDKTTLSVNAKTLHAKCGDINGDGKPDLIVTEAGEGNHIFIFQNKSSGPGNLDFSQSVIEVPGTKVKRIELADLDGDGKPEIVVGNQSGNNVIVIPNSSTLSIASFDPAHAQTIEIPFQFTKGIDGLAVYDLNNDGKPEVIASRFQTAESGMYILRNSSTPGHLSLGSLMEFNLTGTSAMVKVADIDLDGRPEVIASLLLGSGVAIFQNTSSGEDISFSDYQVFQTDERPYGIDLGDLDGDGKPDIVIASILKPSLTILNNTSTAGNLSFTKLIKPTSYVNRHLIVGDVDGDGKPDITFTSVDSDGVPASKISIFRNKHCIIPKILPEGPHTVCLGNSIELSTTPSKGLSYEWKKGATTILSGEAASFSPTETGAYTVRTTSTVDAACALTSGPVTVNFEAASTPDAAPAILPVDPVCIGSSLSLKAVDIGATKYVWSGPAGYESEGLTAHPVIDNFQRINAGRYTLKVFSGPCFFGDTSIVVAVLDAPSFKLNVGEMYIDCESETMALTIDPQPENYNYQWYEKSSGAISGATSTTLTVSSNGEYYAVATTALSCASGQTATSKVFFASPPVGNFSAPEKACLNQEVSFENQSTGNADIQLLTTWDFGDGGHSDDQDPTHAYVGTGDYHVKLTASYDGGFCTQTVVKTIAIGQSPDVQIITDSGKSKLCDGETLTLQVNEGFETYAWQSGETTPQKVVSAPGVYAVDVSTSGGCQGSAVIEIGEYPKPEVTIISAVTEITEGESTALTATGLESYNWSPDELVDVATGPTVNASPKSSTIFTVSGTDQNGCAGEAQIEIRVKGDLATKKIIPSKFFSPGNGDEINKVWTVDKITDYPRCGVQIFDDKGVKVFDAKPYNNDWDGTYNGRALPDGVYFFIIKCDGEENSPKTGTITLLR